MKPMEHARSSAAIFGGTPEEYLDIHQKMDCSKVVFPDLRHRALTHTDFWIEEVMIPLFGEERFNSAGRVYSVREVAENHIMEDFRGHFVPSVGDFLQEMEFADWMNNAEGGAVPPSRKKVITRDKAPDGAMSPHTHTPLLVVPPTKEESPPEPAVVIHRPLFPKLRPGCGGNGRRD